MLCISLLACGDTPTSNGNGNLNSNANSAERTCSPISDTPTEAYKRLFAAVKEKNAEKVKAEMSKRSQELAEAMGSMQKKTADQMYVNGFTATTFSPTLPEIRDERIRGCWAAVEVRDDKGQRWEDLPLVNEDGQWKFAFGDAFGGGYESPGKGMDAREKEAANVARGNMPMAPNPIGNANSNTNSKSAPAYDGPQVEPLKRKK